MTGHGVVYAVHNFEAENEDEINFYVGEPILVLEKDEKYMDGWWQGRNVSGETGLFPMNYTSPEKPVLHDHRFLQSPLLSIRSSTTGSTVEDEIDNTLSQIQLLDRPELWDVEQVADWLKRAGFGAVVSNFIDQEITGDILLDLDIDALKELGINTFGKRYKIMQAITSLKESVFQHVKAPKPNSSVSTSVISQSKKSATNTLRRSNSQTFSISSSVGLYKSPRKAPIPPNSDRSSIRRLSPANSTQHQQHYLPERPSSPQSLESSKVSRSNTFTTVSSKTSSNGSVGSRELGSDPKQRILSSKIQPAEDDHMPKNDWLPNDIHNTTAVHPLNVTPTLSTSKFHKLSVSSVEDPSLNTSTNEPFQAPEHEGWLHKQSDKYKTWNKRWFVLKGSNLFYFKSPKDVRMKGIINLRGYKIIVDESIHTGKYCFKAQHDRERTFFFYTDTEDSMRLWLKMLMKTTIARDFKTPVMSSNQIATVPLEVARRMRPRPPSVIMFKNNQKQVMNEPSLSIMEEEEELHPTLYQQQSQESGVVTADTSISTEDAPSMSSQHDFYEKEEDLIDPQHDRLPLENTFESETSSFSNDSRDGWTNQEYVDWINSYLKSGKKVIDISSAFRNGDTLIQLLEAISGKQVRRPPPQKGGSMSVLILDNIVAAFKFMGREGVEVDGGFTIKDIFSGNETKIIVMLDALRTWSEQYVNKVTNGEGWRGSAMMDRSLYNQ